MMFRLPTAFFGALALVLALWMPAATAQQDNVAAGATGAQVAPANPSGLPIPRWVSIRAKEANLRTGPGARYPIDWLLQRRNLPAEVIGEFENWRKIRIQDGTEGWVHKSMLSGRRMAAITDGRARMRLDPTDNAPIAAFVETGVIVTLRGCEATWCQVAVDGHGVEGWLPRTALWGIYADEAVGR